MSGKESDRFWLNYLWKKTATIANLAGALWTNDAKLAHLALTQLRVLIVKLPSSIFNELQFTKFALALCFHAFSAWKTAHIFLENVFSASAKTTRHFAHSTHNERRSRWLTLCLTR